MIHFAIISFRFAGLRRALSQINTAHLSPYIHKKKGQTYLPPPHPPHNLWILKPAVRSWFTPQKQRQAVHSEVHQHMRSHHHRK